MTRIFDVCIMIVIPFLVPAVVLPITNGPSSLTLTNFAFGFVAVAVAGVARAVTAKTDEWAVFLAIAFTCVVFLTALAVADDTSKESDHLTHLVLQETQPGVSPHGGVLREAALAVNAAAPGLLHWAFCVGLGLLLVGFSFALIWRER
jgi:hypothetical protein